MMKKQKNTVPMSARPLNESTMHKVAQTGYRQSMTPSQTAPVAPLLRTEIGDVLREIRRKQGRTLREVSSDAQVSLGYLSVFLCGTSSARFQSVWPSLTELLFPIRCPMTCFRWL